MSQCILAGLGSPPAITSKCARCGKPLSDPDSVAARLGPACRAKTADITTTAVLTKLLEGDHVAVDELLTATLYLHRTNVDQERMIKQLNASLATAREENRMTKRQGELI